MNKGPGRQQDGHCCSRPKCEADSLENLFSLQDAFSEGVSLQVFTRSMCEASTTTHQTSNEMIDGWKAVKF